MIQIEEDLFQIVKENIREQLDLSQSTSDVELLEHIEKVVFSFSKTTFLSAKEKKVLVDRVFHSFRGLDVLQTRSTIGF